MRRSTSDRSRRSTVRGRGGGGQARLATPPLHDGLGLVVAEVVLAPESGGLADHPGKVGTRRRLCDLTAPFPRSPTLRMAHGAGPGCRIGAVSTFRALRILSRRQSPGEGARAASAVEGGA